MTGMRNDPSAYTMLSLPIVNSARSACSASLPPSVETNGYFPPWPEAKASDSEFTYAPNAAPTSYAKLGRLGGPRVTWKIAFVFAFPPTMSICTAALKCARISGRKWKSAIVASISAGQMKRIVRAGRGIRPSFTSLFSARATSRIVAQPLALSFAPGR